MEPLRPLPLSLLKETEPMVYAFMQDLIRATIRQSPQIVRTMAGQGIAGESLHEAMEGLLEKGLLRFRMEDGPTPEEAAFYLQVYDVRDLTYRDVGVNPWPQANPENRSIKMTTYYRIAGWDHRYEVDNAGEDWAPGKPFCQGPLEYIRFSVAEMKRIDLGGLDGFRALGMFRILVELVAGRPRPLREGGVIRNDKGEPATVEEIALMLQVGVATVQEGLRLLTRPDVALLEEVVTRTEVHG